jgi:DNA-binding NarL/FixJ family response regulator
MANDAGIPRQSTAAGLTGRPPARRKGARSQQKRSGSGIARDARILVVEDDYIVATELEAGLTEFGLQVVGIADTADKAVSLARAERPTLAIMDVRLAGKRDGVDAALEIFEELGVRSIFATAHHDPSLRSRADRAAPLGWLSKPYTIDSAVAAVGEALRTLKKRQS